MPVGNNSRLLLLSISTCYLPTRSLAEHRALMAALLARKGTGPSN